MKRNEACKKSTGRMNMERRNFISSMSMGSAGLALLLSGCKSFSGHNSGTNDYDTLLYQLLKEWCDAMIEHQVNDSSDPETHGMLRCPACEPLGIVHGRCWDAVYPGCG